MVYLCCPRPDGSYNLSSVISESTPGFSRQLDVPGSPLMEGRPGGILIRWPKPLQLAPFNTKELQLSSELLEEVRVPYPISKAEPRQAPEETHFSHLYPQTRSFNRYPRAHDHRSQIDWQIKILAFRLSSLFITVVQYNAPFTDGTHYRYAC